MTVLNRKIAPDFKEIDSINFTLPEVKKLDNGIPFIQYNLGSQDLIKIDIVFDGGTKYQEKPLVAEFTNSMLREGTKNYSSLEIANKVDYYGAFLETDLNADFATISLYTLNKYSKEVLPILYEILTEVNFPEAEFNKQVKIKKQRYLINQEKVETIASKAFSKIVFKGTAYESKTTIESFDNITVEDCKKFYQERYNLKEANIFVAGKLDNSIFNLINDSFGKLSINDIIPAFNFGKVNQKSEFQYVDKPDAIQSSLRIGKPLVKINHPDFNKLQVLNTIFGGYFGSRLMANIREDKGYTYGIGSVMMNRMDMGNLIIYTEVGKEVTQPALNEIRKEITTLQTVKPSEEELYKVKNYMLGSLLQNTDGAFDMLSRYKTLYYHNLPNNYYQQYIKEINSTTAEEILKLAQTYYNDLTFVVAGSQKVD
ncbi:MAG: M16 family metallopeptidase [Flavobacteriales bacterium]